MICTQAAVDQGALPTLQSWWGEITPAMIERAEAIGPCSRPYDFQVVDEPSGLWTIALTSPLISVFALLLLRSSMKQGEKLDHVDQKSRLTSRSLYIGFRKSDGTDGHFATLLVVFPLLNGGEFDELRTSGSTAIRLVAGDVLPLDLHTSLHTPGHRFRSHDVRPCFAEGHGVRH